MYLPFWGLWYCRTCENVSSCETQDISLFLFFLTKTNMAALQLGTVVVCAATCSADILHSSRSWAAPLFHNFTLAYLLLSLAWPLYRRTISLVVGSCCYDLRLWHAHVRILERPRPGKIKHVWLSRDLDGWDRIETDLSLSHTHAHTHLTAMILQRPGLPRLSAQSQPPPRAPLSSPLEQKMVFSTFSAGKHGCRRKC